jgi:ribosomal-protein-alanine N-acetyltransferase
MSARSVDPGSAARYTLRDMAPTDLADVVAVEAAAFPSPWTRGMFEEELRHPLSWKRVIERDLEQVVAFVICRFYGDVWHVMDLAVAPGHRGRGLAGRLLDEFLDRVPPDTPIVLEVREGNDAATRLYRSRGFREAGRRPGYYHDTDEAALLMVHGPEVDW